MSECAQVCTGKETIATCVDSTPKRIYSIPFLLSLRDDYEKTAPNEMVWNPAFLKMQRRFEKRKKQIEHVKNTPAYQFFEEKAKQRGVKVSHFRPPNVYQNCSKRCFEDQILGWRKRLSKFVSDYNKNVE